MAYKTSRPKIRVKQEIVRSIPFLRFHNVASANCQRKEPVAFENTSIRRILHVRRRVCVLAVELRRRQFSYVVIRNLLLS